MFHWDFMLNNLHAAVANSLAAHASGCDAIDACIRGYGAGAGNLSMETFVALLEKDGCSGLDLKQLTELSGSLERLFQNLCPVLIACQLQRVIMEFSQVLNKNN